ncbi:MAG: S8 family serine peptidase, partial [Planctomycetes bacterium]|nr:S8 family serine peptidase [Planctomycetota bacterium]
MRWQSAWAFLALVGGVVAVCATLTHVSSQEATLAKAQERRPAGSLEFGPVFDEPARQEFEAQLTSAERERLIRLKSRSILASPDFPLPTHEPVQPFYLKLRGPMPRSLASRLAAAGASFVGYVNPDTHIMRAVDAPSLTRIANLLQTEALAAGTALQHPADKQSRGLLERGLLAPVVGELSILFWRDVSPETAEALLKSARAAVLDSVEPSCPPGPENPLLRVSVDAEGAALLLASPLLENLALPGWKVADNQTSAAIAKADPATIGAAPYSLDGTDQIVGVWDGGGARDTHEQFQNAPTPSLINNGAKRVRKIDGAANDDHATHVSGTIIGDGTNRAQAKGFAPKAYVLSHDWNSIDSERRSAKHNYNHAADNHSYADFNGGSDDWGDYTSGTQVVDRTNRDFLLCQVQSAGNYQASQPSGSGTKPFSGGTCTVPSYNAHRNGFIIGAVTDTRDITSFSSLGPALDGRLVPQFCANGEGLESATAGSNTSYASYSGTSMSGPSFCGGVALLAQLWRREHADQLLAPDVARSLIALTCQDRGNAGPDYKYGFGIIDVQAAADLVLDDRASGGLRIVRGQVRQAGSVEYPVTVASTATPLRVVCSWLDIFASTTAATTLVNDLDLELVDPSGGVHYPFSGVQACAAGNANYTFTATGPNRRDNIELAEVASPAVGTWLVRVKGFNLPANPQTGYPNSVQGFALASSHNLGAQKLFVDDAVNGGTAVAIPDNNTAGITRTFSVADSRVITQVRV